MIKNNIFGKEDPDKREWEIKFCITKWLTMILQNAKCKNYVCMQMDTYELKGMIFYAKMTEDIDEETYNKIYKLIHTIQKKYR